MWMSQIRKTIISAFNYKNLNHPFLALSSARAPKPCQEVKTFRTWISKLQIYQEAFHRIQIREQNRDQICNNPQWRVHKKQICEIAQRRKENSPTRETEITLAAVPQSLVEVFRSNRVKTSKFLASTVDFKQLTHIEHSSFCFFLPIHETKILYV